MCERIIAVAAQTVLSERRQAVAAETGALVHQTGAKRNKAHIAKDVETMGNIATMPE